MTANTEIARFHPLPTQNPKPPCFSNPFHYQADALCKEASALVVDYIEGADYSFLSEASKGKMLGVLVAESADGQLGFLAAYSGQINSTFGSSYFVPAIFDYLAEDGYFKTREREISQLSQQIAQKENSGHRATLEQHLAQQREAAYSEVEKAKAEYSESRKRRLEIRSQGNIEPEIEQQLIRESQHQKAEIARLKKKASASISQAEKTLQDWDSEIYRLKNERKQQSDSLQRWLFSQMELQSYQGGSKSVLEVFHEYNGALPPSGSGECCAPKLLQYAFAHHLKPISMAEFWYGQSPKQEIRHHLSYYPACSSKCKPLLGFMLKGLSYPPSPLESNHEFDLEYIYEDDAVIVASKPAGMLSVPGKSAQKSAFDIVRERSGSDIWICHRLDMATSGLLVFAKGKAAYDSIHSQFESHCIKKRYVAVLDGIPENKKGKISLPLSADLSDRPRQIVDLEHGKLAITEYEIVSTMKNGRALAYLFPHTGRTHQLRVHCAHADGLGIPILGDALYGRPSNRLYLHAERISFLHPASGRRITVEKEAEFQRNA